LANGLYSTIGDFRWEAYQSPTYVYSWKHNSKKKKKKKTKKKKKKKRLMSLYI
jgi:hypothetical protein